MPDLRTTYLGLELRSPVVASASPRNDRPDEARRAEDAGAAAIVLPSLFEEEILHDELRLTATLEAGAEHHAEAVDYFPAVDAVLHTGDRYLTTIERLKAAVSVPVIASLNATSPGGWVRYARLMADAGADAIELNLYHVAADPALGADGRRGPRPRADRGGAGKRRDPPRGEAQPVLLGDGELRRPGPSPPGRTASCCSTASTSPTSTSRRSTWWPGSTSASRGSCGCRCGGSPSCGPSSGPPSRSPPPPASTGAPTSSRRSWWGPTSP